MTDQINSYTDETLPTREEIEAARQAGSLSFQRVGFEDPDLTISAEAFAHLRHQIGDDGKLLQYMTEVALGGQEGAFPYGEVNIELHKGELLASWDDGDVRRTDPKEFVAFVEREHPEVHAAAYDEVADELILGPRDERQPEQAQGIDLAAETAKFEARTANRPEAASQSETLSR